MATTTNKAAHKHIWRAWLLAAAAYLAAPAQAIEVPAGWDLTFAAQRAEAPPIRRGWNDTFNLYQTIDKRGWQMRYFLQQVPLTRLDEAVFVQHDVGDRYGLFIDGEHAWLLRDRDYSSVDMREVEAGAARKIIRQFARRDGPTRHASFQITEGAACSAEVAHAVVSVYSNGKAKQYWLSGADFCEIHTDLLSPVKQILCGGHCRTTQWVPLWASRLEEELNALPAVGATAAAPALERKVVLRQANELLANGGSAEAMCQAVNELLDLPSPARSGRVRDFKDPDEGISAAMVALMGRVDTRCTYKTGAPLLEILVRRSPVAVIEAALKAGFPVNQKDYHTPLDVAIFENRQDVQQVLERAGGVRHTTQGK
ncbi:hypothetical protein GCM10027277_56750 [Pseudoduganella ginsengisoli]|uniref:Ankyrin repeat domain-containing protein n=1 Tax=Pseudoduganella ginsengisoli TaxID=1462440 RepID=A0A6L6Q4E9_9BURK|nr:hypothetical protein [Pseudoduganella ginsengisoli]MTW03952.1 hypothetical protein [Pseudoduganella ginsengisoli]